MLRIFTFLRNAFERPPEREGREIFVRKGHPLGPLSEDEEDTPTEDRPEGEKETEPDDSITHTTEAMRRGTEDALQKPEKEHGIAEEAYSLRRQMQELNSLLNNKGLLKELQRAQGKARKNPTQETFQTMDIHNWATEILEGPGGGKDSTLINCTADSINAITLLGHEANYIQQFEGGAIDPATFIHWMRSMHDDADTSDLSLTGIAGQLDTFLPHVDNPVVAADWSPDPRDTDDDRAERQGRKQTHIRRLCALFNVQERKKLIQEKIRKMKENVEENLKKARELREAFDKDQEERKITFTDFLEGCKEFWHEGMQNTIAILSIWKGIKLVWDAYKKKWESQTDSAAAKIAYKIAGYIPDKELQQKTRNILEKKDKEEMETEKITFIHMPFSAMHEEFAGFTQSTPKGKILAWLEIAANKGWLYDTQGTGSATTAFGKQLATFLPSYWTDPQKEEFLQDLGIQNSQAQEKREAAGMAAASQMGPPPGKEGAKGQAWFIIPHIREALAKHDYHFARGLVKKAINKGDLGNSPTWAAVAILKTLQRYPEATKFLGEDIIKGFGYLIFDPQNRAAQGFLLSTLKFRAGDYVTLAGKGSGEHLMLPGDSQVIGAAITKTEDLIRTNGGRIQFEKMEIKAGIDRLSEEDQWEYAVAKILAGDAVRVGTAVISLYNNVEEFHRYRDTVADTSYKEKLNFENMDSDYANTINEYLLHDRTKIAPTLYAGTDGRLPRASFVNGQFVQIGELAKKLQGEPTAYATFIAEQKKRWKEPLIQFLQHRTPKIAEMRDGIPLMFELGIISTNDLHIGQGEEQVRPQTARELNAFLQEARSSIRITIPTTP